MANTYTKSVSYLVAALYKFVRLDNYKDMQKPILELCLKHNIRGTILLAQEGINSTIAGKQEDMRAILAYLRSDPRLADLEHKESFTSSMPFHRMKVRLKQEIVTLKEPGVDPTTLVGQYVDPKDWNALISSKNAVLIDTRNDYEVEMGTFKNAINPKTEVFSQFPTFVKEHLSNKKDAKIVTWCTGGIRCEKATSWLLKEGFKNVYHLKGGILKYLEVIPPEESLWEGECFVFDQRVGVKHGLEPGDYKLCYACQMPVSAKDQESSHYKLGLSCPKCYDKLTLKQKERLKNRQHQVEMCAKRGEKHIGI